MSVFKITVDDGRVFHVEAPDSASAGTVVEQHLASEKAPAQQAPQGPQFGPDAPRSMAEDFFKSIPRGIVQGLASHIGSYKSPLDQLTGAQEELDARGAPELINKQADQLPAPEGLPGRFGQTIGHVSGNPLNWVGPGSLATKSLWNAAAGIGSEGAALVKDTSLSRGVGGLAPLILERALTRGRAGGAVPPAPESSLPQAAQGLRETVAAETAPFTPQAPQAPVQPPQAPQGPSVSGAVLKGVVNQLPFGRRINDVINDTQAVRQAMAARREAAGPPQAAPEPPPAPPDLMAQLRARGPAEGPMSGGAPWGPPPGPLSSGVPQIGAPPAPQSPPNDIVNLRALLARQPPEVAPQVPQAPQGPPVAPPPSTMNDALVQNTMNAIAALRQRPATPPPPAVPVPERIIGTGFKVGDKVFEGPNHIAAMDRAVKELKLGGTDELIDAVGGLGKPRMDADGFMTSTGRFVSRAEAAAISEAANQGKASRPGSLKMEDINPVVTQQAMTKAQTPQAPPVAEDGIPEFLRRNGPTFNTPVTPAPVAVVKALTKVNGKVEEPVLDKAARLANLDKVRQGGSFVESQDAQRSLGLLDHTTAGMNPEQASYDIVDNLSALGKPVRDRGDLSAYIGQYLTAQDALAHSVSKVTGIPLEKLVPHFRALGSQSAAKEFRTQLQEFEPLKAGRIATALSDKAIKDAFKKK